MAAERAQRALTAIFGLKDSKNRLSQAPISAMYLSPSTLTPLRDPRFTSNAISSTRTIACTASQRLELGNS